MGRAAGRLQDSVRTRRPRPGPPDQLTIEAPNRNPEIFGLYVQQPAPLPSLLRGGGTATTLPAVGDIQGRPHEGQQQAPHPGVHRKCELSGTTLMCPKDPGRDPGAGVGGAPGSVGAGPPGYGETKSQGRPV